MMDDFQVIYFDGVCNLCNSFVDFVIRRDKKRKFRFSSLQSEAGQKINAAAGLSNDWLSTVVLERNGKIYTKSKAAILIISQLSFPWPLFYIFILVPRFLSDFIYRLVAKNRFKWFGSRSTCRMPSAEEKELFI